MARLSSTRSSIRRKIAAVGLSAALLTGAFAGPAAAATNYDVKSGDTLSGVAQELGLKSWRTLLEANPSIVDPDLIYAGQNLVVPDGDESASDNGSSTSRSEPKQSAPKQSSTKQQSTKKQSSGQAAKAAASSSSAGVWDKIAQCESTGNWSINTGNGFYGGLQFTLSSWRAVGGSGYPHHASKAEQIMRAEKLQDLQGWGAWPACSAKLGLR